MNKCMAELYGLDGIRKTDKKASTIITELKRVLRKAVTVVRYCIQEAAMLEGEVCHKKIESICISIEGS